MNSPYGPLVLLLVSFLIWLLVGPIIALVLASKAKRKADATSEFGG